MRTCLHQQSAVSGSRQLSHCPWHINNAAHRNQLHVATRISQFRAEGRHGLLPVFHATPADEEEQAPFSPFRIKPGFFEKASLDNREPDYQDPDWFEKVTDWDEFWNYSRWDMETEGQMGDDYDVAGNPTRTMDRAYQMISAFRQIEARPDVINIEVPETRRQHIGVWDDPPVQPETQPELPPWTVSDWRALAEKQKYKELMDMEWRRRQSKIGKIKYEDPARDVRLRRFDYLNESMDWSHEQMYALITQDGTACRPEDHKGIVENPLVNVDMPNVMGVDYIEETEEFLERIGHLGVPEAEIDLDYEVIMDLASGAVPPDVAEEMLEVPLQLMGVVAAAEREAQQKDESNTWRGDFDD